MFAEGQHDARLFEYNAMDEEESAEFAGYVYTPENILSGSFRQAHRNAYLGMVDNDGEEVPQCACSVIDGRKCGSRCDCPNRFKKVSCPAYCGPACRNNWWRNGDFVLGKSSFMIKSTDEYVRTGGKHYRVYASKLIPKGALLGEITGNVRHILDDLHAEEYLYAVAIPLLDQVIDSTNHGTIASRINNNPDGNTSSFIYGYDSQVRVVVQAIRTIYPGEEITSTYNYKDDFNTLNTTSLSPRQNELEAASPERMDIVPAVAPSATQRQEELLRNYWPRVGDNRPTNYIERHIFLCGDRVFIIHSENQRLIKLKGTIVDEYKTEKGMQIFIVKITGDQLHHIPRWMIFRFAEDMDFAVKHMMDDNDKQQMEMYTVMVPNRTLATSVGIEFLQHYVRVFSIGQPPRALIRNEIGGAQAVGLSPNIIVQHSDPVQHDRLIPQGRPLPDGDPDDFIQVPLARVASPQPTTSPGSMVGDADAESPMDEQPSTSRGITCASGSQQPIFVQRPQTNYSEMHRRDFQETRNLAETEMMRNRMIRNVTEQVSFFAYSRIPPTTDITYSNVFAMVYQLLRDNYTRTDIIRRCYARFAHYRWDCEQLIRGAWNLRYCPLCRKSHTFVDSKSLWDHFQLAHAICANKYECKCRNCDFKTSLPSEWRLHVITEHPDTGIVFDNTIPLAIWDGIADFIATKSGSGRPTYVIRPGLPNFTDNENPDPHSRHGRSNRDAKKKIKMDLVHRRPVDPNIEMKFKGFQIQQHYSRLEGWDDLMHSIPPRAIQEGEQHEARRGRGRPRKAESSTSCAPRGEGAVRRGRGRPRKSQDNQPQPGPSNRKRQRETESDEGLSGQEECPGNKVQRCENGSRGGTLRGCSRGRSRGSSRGVSQGSSMGESRGGSRGGSRGRPRGRPRGSRGRGRGQQNDQSTNSEEDHS